MKILFHNQSIEDINLETILFSKDIQETIPLAFKQKNPTVVYNYINPIRNRIFNHVNAIQNIDTPHNNRCACSQSKFCHPSLKHIITGDLGLVQNATLRNCFNSGHSTGYPQSQIGKTLFPAYTRKQNFASFWCHKEKHPKEELFEWTDKVLQKVHTKIESLQRLRPRKNEMTDILENPEIKSALKLLHKDFVLAGADKASNNVIIMCKQYYVNCIRRELSTDNKIYEKCTPTSNEIIETHLTYMANNKFKVDAAMHQLPHFYGIPKMHKNPPSLRYIAASNKCTTKTMSSIITPCLKLVTYQHRLLCDTIYQRTGVNRMLVIDNSEKILARIASLNNNPRIQIKNIHTYDFTTLYTNIPHEDLKTRLKWVISKVFKDEPHKQFYVKNGVACWHNQSSNDKTPVSILDQESLYRSICFLIDNIYICVGQSIFRQKIGIPMGTDCAPFIANLYLYACEYAYLDKLTKTDIKTARKFSNSFRYIDDLLTIDNNNLFLEHVHEIYPTNLILKRSNVNNDQICNFLDLNLQILDGRLHTTLYDKRNDFDFTINSFPNLSANIHKRRTHSVLISQLIRFSKACTNVEDFCYASSTLVKKLEAQFFDKKLLKKKVCLFFDKYYELVSGYNLPKKVLLQRLF